MNILGLWAWPPAHGLGDHPSLICYTSSSGRMTVTYFRSWTRHTFYSCGFMVVLPFNLIAGKVKVMDHAVSGLQLLLTFSQCVIQVSVSENRNNFILTWKGFKRCRGSSPYKTLERMEKQSWDWASRSCSQNSITELASKGPATPAITKKVENQETVTEINAPETHNLNNSEIRMPHYCSCCLQSHTDPAIAASAKTACPASCALTLMD